MGVLNNALLEDDLPPIFPGLIDRESSCTHLVQEARSLGTMLVPTYRTEGRSLPTVPATPCPISFAYAQ